VLVVAGVRVAIPTRVYRVMRIRSGRRGRLRVMLMPGMLSDRARGDVLAPVVSGVTVVSSRNVAVGWHRSDSIVPTANVLDMLPCGHKVANIGIGAGALACTGRSIIEAGTCDNSTVSSVISVKSFMRASVWGPAMPSTAKPFFCW
jgi:hypothetical protein